MTTHLSATVLNALVDGELPVEQFAATKEHLDQCPSCTSSALSQALLKTATAKAGQRYTLPPQLQERLRRVASSQDLRPASRLTQQCCADLVHQTDRLVGFAYCCGTAGARRQGLS